MEAVVPHRVAFLKYFCPKQGQDFKPLAAPLYPNMGQVPPSPLAMLPLATSRREISQAKRVKGHLRAGDFLYLLRSVL